MSQHEHLFQYESASAKLVHVQGDIWALSNVWSTQRKQGHASNVLQQVVDFADIQQLFLNLVVQCYGPAHDIMMNDQLEVFYGKYGFIKRMPQSRPYVMQRTPREKFTPYNETQPTLTSRRTK